MQTQRQDVDTTNEGAQAGIVFTLVIVAGLILVFGPSSEMWLRVISAIVLPFGVWYLSRHRHD